ncbi:unnamed protein product [Spirodela intermedia]|uniref:Uncharacterized protein n=1 Tax=Spirodela intermedia TaxID=51605 RepID=A0A7I8JC43_SPIIN|nr:unnamed protein product [Spirodela intermedia]CAA6667073.1 unnamed protein product [Spirodela intermedia]
MEQVRLQSSCFQYCVLSFQEVLDWRFLISGDFLLVSFANYT